MRVLTLARDLRRRKAREREALFVVEGIRAAEELLRSSIEAVGVLAAPKLAEAPRGAALLAAARERGWPVSEVTDREFRSATETDSPQGALVVARVPARSMEDVPTTEPLRLLVLDGVQDPGNVGALIRTAAGLGATATIALPGTVDVWNAKVVRSAMGAHFHHLAFHASWEALQGFLRTHGIALWAGDTRGEAPPAQAPPRLAIAVGNEGGGLSDAVRGAAERVLALPLAPAVESLNVAVAAGILLYALRP
jgi:TrmH family RNA methyltransferase